MSRPELTLRAIRDKMVELENEHGEDVGVGEAIAKMIGVPPELVEVVEESLLHEGGRARMLTATFYGRKVAVLPDEMATMVALAQGVSFAIAVRELLGEC